MPLTNEQKNFVLENYKTMTIKQMSDKLGAEKRTISNFCYTHHLDYLREKKVDFKKLTEYTQKEKEVLMLLLAGFSRIKIQEKLCISYPTLYTHLQNIRYKKNYHSDAEIIANEWPKLIKSKYFEKNKVVDFLEKLKLINNFREIHEEINLFLKEFKNGKE